MSDLRDVGAIPLDFFSGPNPRVRDFVRIDVPTGPGTIRYTNHPRGFTGSIDGGAATWVFYDFKITGLANGADQPLSAPTLSIANVNGYWSGLARTYGIRRVPLTVFTAGFDGTGVLIGAWPVWVGRLSAHRATSRLQVSLSPYTAQMAHSSPSESIGKLCGYLYREADTCQYTGAEPGGQVTCNHTRNNCNARGNLLNWGGEDKAPDPNVTYHWGKVARALPTHPAATSGSGSGSGPTSTTSRTKITPVTSPTPVLVSGRGGGLQTPPPALVGPGR